jgi:hypothetical protein
MNIFNLRQEKKTPAMGQGLVGAQSSPLPPPIREVVVSAILAGVLAWIEILTVAGQRRTLFLHTGFAVRPAHPGVQAPKWSEIDFIYRSRCCQLLFGSFFSSK